MGLEWPSPASRPNRNNETVANEHDTRTAEEQELYNVVQGMTAKLQFIERHPERTVEEIDGNEVMTEFIVEGSAEEFERKYGALGVEKLQEVLREVMDKHKDTEEIVETKDSETLH